MTWCSWNRGRISYAQLALHCPDQAEQLRTVHEFKRLAVRERHRLGREGSARDEDPGGRLLSHRDAMQLASDRDAYLSFLSVLA